MSWIPTTVGQGPTIIQQGADVAMSYADAYTYGGASQALSEGQAMLAWAELAKAQNSPQFESYSTPQAKIQCPSGFLISPGGKTCVNREAVHIALSYVGWPWYSASPVTLYMRLHDPLAINKANLNGLADAFMRAIRALGMTDGSTGWANVKSHARAVAWTAAGTDSGDVDSIQDGILARIAPYYDADVAAAAQRPAPRRFFRTPIRVAGGSGLGVAVTGALALGALYYFKPAAARVLVSKVSSIGRSAVSKVKGIAK